MLTGKKYQYFWFVSGFVCLVIAVGAGPTGESAFHIAILRTQETGLGILVYSLVSVFLWPQRSGGALKAIAGGVLDAQHRIFQTYSAAFGETVAQHDGRALRMQQVQVLNQFRVTLAGAKADTRDVWEASRRWSTIDELATELGEAMERWRASFPEIVAFDVSTLMPNLPSVLSEV